MARYSGWVLKGVHVIGLEIASSSEGLGCRRCRSRIRMLSGRKGDGHRFLGMSGGILDRWRSWSLLGVGENQLWRSNSQTAIVSVTKPSLRLTTHVFANDLLQGMRQYLPGEYLYIFLDISGLRIGETHDDLEERLTL